MEEDFLILILGRVQMDMTIPIYTCAGMLLKIILNICIIKNI